MDGRRTGPDCFRIEHLTFSPDGKRVAYLAVLNRAPSKLVIDGVPGPEISELSEILFSADSKHCAALGNQGQARTGQSYLILDGAQTEIPRPIAGTHLAFAPNGTVTVFCGQPRSSAAGHVDRLEIKSER
jgi:hypothetical protein